MLAIGEDGLACSRIPYLDGGIVAGGGDGLSMGGPGDRAYAVRVTAVGEEKLSCPGIPDLGCIIGIGRSDTRAIGGPGDIAHIR